MLLTEQVHNQKSPCIPEVECNNPFICMSIHNARVARPFKLPRSTCTTVPYNNYLAIYCII